MHNVKRTSELDTFLASYKKNYNKLLDTDTIWDAQNLFFLNHHNATWAFNFNIRRMSCAGLYLMFAIWWDTDTLHLRDAQNKKKDFGLLNFRREIILYKSFTPFTKQNLWFRITGLFGA